MAKKGVVIFYAAIVFLVLLTFAILAMNWQTIWNTISGKAASSQPTNVTISVSGVSPAQVVYVSPISAISPNISGPGAQPVTFYAHVSDDDGYSDINTSSVQANFSRAGESLRENLTCSLVEAGIDSTTSNFSCIIDMWYWDEDGAWDITVRAKDRGNLSWAYNTSTNFTYSLAKSMEISPQALTWPSISPGDTNKTSDNDPTYVNNTGNYNSTIELKGVDLIGDSDTDYKIYAGNFTVDIETSSDAEPNVECVGSDLVNGSFETITGSSANRGNLSLGGGSGQEEIYYCLTTVPQITSQTYSTDTGGKWYIRYPA